MISLQPYLPYIITALSFAVSVRQAHTDDHELLHLLGSAARGLLLSNFSIAPLIAMLPLLPSELLTQRRGRKMVTLVVELLALNAFGALRDAAARDAVCRVLSIQLRSMMPDAAKDAAHSVAVLSAAAEPAFVAGLVDEYVGWAASEKPAERKAAATGLGGVLGARTYNADESTWRALTTVLALCKDAAQPVRTLASEFAAGWRQAVRENPIVRREIDPELEQRELQRPLTAVQSAAAASFAYA